MLIDEITWHWQWTCQRIRWWCKCFWR